jgi:hypothetical protein
MYSEPNRIAQYFPAPKVEQRPQSVADVLLQKAWSAKIELLRFEDDDGSDCSCEVEIRSTIDADDINVLAALLAEFRKPRGGEAVAQ